ncbi:hypothetical protein [Rhizobium sp. BK176]|uniref:hypothetical protein n=1 Tax=Rhizobium sp. BK176 TaxID=2587071 RepID=UPI002169A591|nr:hypothetical protein [Rhizobium sp. BK176]MCS4090060.1 hypothetical protein [Rhizobium sp. BK176]
MKRTRLEDTEVGHAVLFPDYWRGKKAICVLVGTGGGPEGESVRIVGTPHRKGGFTVSYVRSYEGESGNARRAYEFLARHFGQPLKATEITSEEGVGFHRHLLLEGVLAAISVERQGYDPETGEPEDVAPPALPPKP